MSRWPFLLRPLFLPSRTLTSGGLSLEETDIAIRIVEPDPSGHHLFYVRLLAEAHPGGIEWVTTRSALLSKQSITHLGGLISSGVIRPLTLDPWPNQWRILKDLGSPGDIVALP